MIEKFTFDLHAPKVEEKLILVKSDGELRAHVVMKLLAYLLFYDSRLKVEVSADMHYKPDLLIPGDHGIPELWIDCGKVAVRKVEKLTTKLKNTRIILVKETDKELTQFKKVIEKKVERADRIDYLAFEPGFVSGIAEALNRVNHLTFYEVMDKVIGIALNDQIFESSLYG